MPIVVQGHIRKDATTVESTPLFPSGTLYPGALVYPGS